MAFGLSEIEIPSGRELPVGDRDGWNLSVGRDGVRFRSGSDPSETMRTQLRALESQGYCLTQRDSYFFSFGDLRSLRPEDRPVLFGFCEWLPCRLDLGHVNSLGHPEFALLVDFFVGNRRVYPEILGPFARLEGEFYQLTDEVWRLLDEVAKLNALPSTDKAKLPEVLKAWASVDSAAAEVDARRDQYLADEQVLVPDRVRLDVITNDAGLVSVVPDFDGVPVESMHRSYLFENEIQDVYHVDSAGHGRIRVVVQPAVRNALEAVRRFRRLTPRERDRLFSRPGELLPDEVDPNAVDLSLYGPRVRGIGEYPATIRPFVRARRPWDDLGRESAETGYSSGPQQVEVGLDLGFDDGSVSHEVFDRPSEADELLGKIDAALKSDDPVVEFRGKRLRADAALRDAVRSCVQSLSKDRNRPPPRDNSEMPEDQLGSGVVGPLIWENIDKSEYGETDEAPTVSPEFMRTRALRSDVSLKPHQEVGVGWLTDSVLAGKRGALLADDMGLGKTLQALSFLAWLIESDALQSGLSQPEAPWDPILVVTPLILLEVWRDEITRFFDEGVFLPYAVLDSSALSRLRTIKGKEGDVQRSVLDLDALRRHRLIISNYDAVANYGFSFGQIRWTAVISDEAHEFKEPSTRVSQVMKSLNTPFRVAMTGTPVVNRLLDVWNLVDFLRPLYLGSQKDFRDQYELKEEDGGPSEGARRLKLSLRVADGPPVTAETVVLRRWKEKELPGLPEKREQILRCPMSEEQRREYVNLVRSVQAQTGKGKMFKLLSGLNQLLQHPALVGIVSIDAEPEALVSSGPKLSRLLDELARVQARGEKALIFAIYHQMQHILKRVLDHRFDLDVEIINGDMSGAGARVRRRRVEQIEEFCRKPGFNVMVLSPDVAGVGLTITAANHVFHFGRWWNPAREDQATDRTYRIGQERTVFVYRLVATDPLEEFKCFDEHLDDLISERRRTSDQFLTPGLSDDAVGEDLAGRVFRSDGLHDETPAEPIMSADAVAALSPDRFEALVARWLAAQGKMAFLTPYAGDAGVDVVAVSEDEVICVQVKHVERKGQAIDEAAVHQVRNGASHYQVSLFPAALRSRRPRIVVISNGRASGRLEAEGRRAGVEFIGGGELMKGLQGCAITFADVCASEAERFASLAELKAALRERFP